MPLRRAQARRSSRSYSRRSCSRPSTHYLEAPADDATLSPEQRERETAKTAAEVLLSERHLANLIWKAIDKVGPRCRQRTADPTAVLGLEIVPRQQLHRWSRNG